MVVIKIETGNDAFQDGNECYEVARILREVVDRLNTGDNTHMELRDTNGNTVGEMQFYEDD